MQKVSSFFINVIFSVISIVLITMISARAEVSWANSSHTKLWAEATLDDAE
jgi:hypothetical protein